MWGHGFNYSEPGDPPCLPTAQRHRPASSAEAVSHPTTSSMIWAAAPRLAELQATLERLLGDHYLLYGDGLSLDVLAEAYSYVRGTWKRHFDANFGGQDNTATCRPSGLPTRCSWRRVTTCARAERTRAPSRQCILARTSARGKQRQAQQPRRPGLRRHRRQLSRHGCSAT